MSLAHGKETHLLEEGIRPTLMIDTPSEAATMLTLTKDRPQPPPHPPIDAGESVGVTPGQLADVQRQRHRNWRVTGIVHYLHLGFWRWVIRNGPNR